MIVFQKTLKIPMMTGEFDLIVSTVSLLLSFIEDLVTLWLYQ